MPYKLLTLEHTEAWKMALDKLPVKQHDIYYTPEYYSLFENKGDGKTQCFIFEDNKGNLALYPYLINSVNVLGYELNDQFYDIQGAYGYNGVISNSNESQFVADFYTCFNHYCKDHNIIAEFTRFNPIISNEGFSELNMNCLFDRVTVSVDLARNYEQIKKGYQRSTRKQINRMLRNPSIKIVYYETFSAPLIDEMYTIYIESMDRLKANDELYFSADFFKSHFEIKNTRLIVFEYEDLPVSFITFFHVNKKLHGFLGGTRNDYLNLSPFSLLYDYMIQYGVKFNLDLLHVGGGTSNDRNDKLLNYKLHFSSQTNDFYIGKKIHCPEIYDQVISQWEQQVTDPDLLKNKQLLKYRKFDSA